MILLAVTSNAFDPGTANKCTVPWWFKKFFKGNESLEDEESNGKPLEVVNDQLRGSLKLILLEPQEKLLRNSRLNILWLLGFWNKLENWKSLISGCLTSWPIIKKKIVILKCHFLLFSATAMDHFLIGLWCTTKSGFYMTITYLMDMSLSKLWDLMMDREIWHAKVYGVTKSWTWLSDCTELIWQLVTTSSIVGPRGRFKALPRAKIAPKRSHAHCLVVCCWSDRSTTVFWIGKTITSEKYAQ